jgi:hypothetical protein
MEYLSAITFCRPALRVYVDADCQHSQTGRGKTNRMDEDQ